MHLPRWDDNEDLSQEPQLLYRHPDEEYVVERLERERRPDVLYRYVRNPHTQEWRLQPNYGQTPPTNTGRWAYCLEAPHHWFGDMILKNHCEENNRAEELFSRMRLQFNIYWRRSNTRFMLALCQVLRSFPIPLELVDAIVDYHGAILVPLRFENNDLRVKTQEYLKYQMLDIGEFYTGSDLGRQEDYRARIELVNDLLSSRKYGDFIQWDCSYFPFQMHNILRMDRRLLSLDEKQVCPHCRRAGHPGSFCKNRSRPTPGFIEELMALRDQKIALQKQVAEYQQIFMQVITQQGGR